MVFLKQSDGTSLIIKFNISSEQEFHSFKKMIGHYKVNIPYSREYEPYEIPHILKSDLSGRILYN